jgi:ketosteroid isomerase-like protein
VAEAGLAVVVALAIRMTAAAPSAGDIKEIEAFNKKFQEVTLRMDNVGAMSLWADDGVTLLPGMGPIAGKKTIAKWLDDVVANMPGYKVTQQDNEFHDIRVSGDWASEWGTTYQVVQPPEGKPPIGGFGKILLVLHKDEGGEWKIKEEMWNAGVKP